MKTTVDVLVVTCDETVDIPESVVINPRNRINYWFIAVVQLSID